MSAREYYPSALEGPDRIPTAFDGVIAMRALSALRAATGDPDSPEPDESVPGPDTVQDTPDKPEEPSKPTRIAPNKNLTRAEGGGEPI